MVKHVILGAGNIGTATARELAAAGHEVDLLSRSGSGPRTEAITPKRVDASDARALTEAAKGAAAIYVCTNPPYDARRWAAEWPPIIAAVSAAAESNGAGVVLAGNLYGYGPVDGPMTESTPLVADGGKGRTRIDMWESLLAAHNEGRFRVAEARGSDYFGPGATTTSHLGVLFMPALLKGRTARVPGDLDAPHTWTYLGDFGRAMAAIGTSDHGWGRAWHVPSAPAATPRHVARRVSELTGAPAPKLRSNPRWLLRTAGVAVTPLREIADLYYQFDRPFVMDSSAMTAAFALEPTPLDDALTATARWWQERAAAKSSGAAS